MTQEELDNLHWTLLSMSGSQYQATRTYKSTYKGMTLYKSVVLGGGSSEYPFQYETYSIEGVNSNMTKESLITKINNMT